MQRTGRLDDTLTQSTMFADFAFRMLHAGGKMFSVPYLVANTTGNLSETGTKATKHFAYALVKSFGILHNLRFLVKNPKVSYFIWKKRKEIFEKRDKATLLSKLKNDFLAELF